MKVVALSAALASAWLVGGYGGPPRPGEPTRLQEATAILEDAARSWRPHSLAPAQLTAVVQQYCVVCHNDVMMTGRLSLQDFSVEEAGSHPETAERMIRKLRAGMMPPPGARRPPPDTLLALVEALELGADRAAAASPTVGDRRFQRLSRAEYARVIRDFLALEVDAGKWLPPDVIMESFDNMADAQLYSTTLLDAYLRAAADVSRLAVGNPEAAAATIIYANPDEVSQHAWDWIEGAPSGTRGGMVFTHDFPADGEYVFELRTRYGSGNPGSVANEDVAIAVDGDIVARLKLPRNNVGSLPEIQSEPIFVQGGQRRVAAAFVNVIEGPYEDRLQPVEWSAAGDANGRYGITGLTHLTELLITGPQNVTGVSDTESRRRIFTCRPATEAEERPCAASILERLASEAYRRPVTEEDVEELMAFYEESVSEKGFEAAVRTGLQALLMSPEFLFRLEREPADGRPGDSYRLNDVDLATRLSFFLWASAPDAELIELASSGRLSDPDVIERQVQRMLEDPRSESLSTRFLHQWLRLQDVGRVWPDGYLFPGFSQQLADAMVRETQLLFQHLVREDRSLLELFNADYTFLNERLAQHYGMSGVSGEDFRLAKYSSDRRSGVFGHGSILHLTSMSDRTSPVLRGKWVMEVIMGTPPPPPPPNVPAFEASPTAAAGRRLTTRERMEVHRRNPVCASCHGFIDPIGLALDNFDAVGKWRIRENMQPLDTRGTFYDGTAISTPAELVDVLLKRPVPLVRNFTSRLLSYAIGRPVEYFDQPSIRAIARAAEADGYKVSDFVLGVVKSDAFQMKQIQATANN